VTSHTDEINQLIADIDHLLSNSSKGLSKFLSHQGQQEKEILQRVRDFLDKQNQEQASENEVVAKITNPSSPSAFSSLLTQFKAQNSIESELEPSSPEKELGNTETVQIKEELSIILQPLQAELSRLLAERASLIQEIRQLEQKRLQNYSLTQQLANQEQMISEFLEVLMGRLVPHLKSNSHVTINSNQQNLEAVTSAIQPILESAERVEQLANLARNLDQRLLSLDGTVNIVFEALECNINTYYQSLSQALAKMHSQGMQGEQLIANFLNNLTQYLQQQFLVNETLISSTNIEIITSPTEETLQSLENENLPIETPAEEVELKNPENVTTEVPATEIASITLETELLADQPESSPDLQLASADEVDELYASFFNPEISAPLNFSFSAETILQEDSNLSIDAETENNSQTVASIADIIPSELSAANVSSESENDDNKIEITSLVEKPQLEPIIEDENSLDTITVLTDLLIETSDEQVPLESLNSLNNSELSTADISLLTLPPITPLDNYLGAASEENLLSLGDNDDPGISEIILNAQQLQQLDQDLANFDQPLNSAGQSITQLNTESQADNVTILLEQEVDLNLTTETYLEAFSQSPITSQQSPITSPQPSIPNDANNELVPGHNDANWYLAIDIGTTGISAALLNRSKLVVYPIYWSAEQQDGTSSFQQSFRLPAEVYLPTNSTSHQGKNGEETATPHLYSAQLKPYLQIAVPYQQERQKWEPMLQLNEFSAGPLIWVVRSLSKLLLTLRSSQTSTTPALIANALGMNTANFSTIIKNIAGVICSCPSNWTEQYRFNIREAIITSQLVSHAQQIFFVEEAIASLLPELDTSHGQSIHISNNQDLQPLKTSDYTLFGNTLTINIGAIATEMALVDIPANLEELTHKNFMLHNFGYSGKGIEQDIICQLLLPPKSRQTLQPGESNSQSANANPWHWQPSIPNLDQMQFSSLGLETLTLPKVGEPDKQARIIFQQRLESSLLGQALLDAALALKLILQHQETFTLELADQRWILQRRDLESQVFVPFVRRLNRELNKLLVARGIPTEAINQAILSGGVASVGTINRWLRQKLPNAKIIQDSYLGENGAPNCSRVALGLAMLPLHPQILDIPKQQYTDYFLFSELLKLLPDRSLSFGEVLQLFESRGINTRICQQRLLAFLEGELPSGLIPAASDSLWLTHHSQDNPDYQTIASFTPSLSPLVEKQGNLSYRPNYQQVQFLLRYLDAIKSSTVQSLDEPYTYLLQIQV
jgi:hypothetical protein